MVRIVLCVWAPNRSLNKTRKQITNNGGWLCWLCWPGGEAGLKLDAESEPSRAEPRPRSTAILLPLYFQCSVFAPKCCCLGGTNGTARDGLARAGLEWPSTAPVPQPAQLATIGPALPAALGLGRPRPALRPSASHCVLHGPLCPVRPLLPRARIVPPSRIARAPQCSPSAAVRTTFLMLSKQRGKKGGHFHISWRSRQVMGGISAPTLAGWAAVS